MRRASIRAAKFEPREHPGFECLRARLGRDIGTVAAHQLVNRTETTVRFLAFSNQQPDAVIYPDSEKLLAAQRIPEGDGRLHMFRITDEVDYYEGEEAP